MLERITMSDKTEEKGKKNGQQQGINEDTMQCNVMSKRLLRKNKREMLVVSLNSMLFLWFSPSKRGNASQEKNKSNISKDKEHVT